MSGGAGAPADLRALLAPVRTVAVLGAKDRPGEPAFYVPAALFEAGLRLWPVNPGLVRPVPWGEPPVPTLADLPGRVDLIDVFRRPETIPGHVDEILALPWRPAIVWLQSGIAHPATARLRAAGIVVVEDRCLMVEHRRWVGRAPGPA